MNVTFECGHCNAKLGYPDEAQAHKCPMLAPKKRTAGRVKVGPVTLTCTNCGQSGPVDGKHVCPAAPALQAQRDAEAAYRAELLRAKPCPDCSGLMTPGRSHACVLQPDPEQQRRLRQLRQLRDALDGEAA
jgi:hypothetical protein